MEKKKLLVCFSDSCTQQVWARLKPCSHRAAGAQLLRPSSIVFPKFGSEVAAGPGSHTWMQDASLRSGGLSLRATMAAFLDPLS